MRLTLLSAEDLRCALPMAEAIQTMKEAFAALSAGTAQAPPRIALDVPEQDAVSLAMPAAITGRALGAKLVSVFPRNPSHGRAVVNGLMVVLDPETGEPAALADGTFLTAWRTGAASGAATDLLARPEARIGALIGCGAQARTQLLAITTARPLEEVRVYGRNPDGVERFVTEMQPRVDARLVAAAEPQVAIGGAEVICTATTSSTPVLDGDWIDNGAHLNGVGSFTTEMQEVDSRTVERARVFIDQRQAALEEAGDLVIAEREGKTSRDHWTELGEVVAREELGRRNDAEVTFFKSVGVAVQDVAAMAQALVRAREFGLGREVEF